MLDNGTKRRIDTARDILVGKLPDPKSQVEQITIALIYKFMDDMDKEAVNMGGKASFFVGDYEKYAWSKIFAPQLGGFEMLALYTDAITRMSQNPNLPQLFRDIFKNAYLPYRDPETLKLFLKTINEFSYDHSERLGDAFEYLLSVLGSQGEAGQFRTPRHIIDFMVQVVAPQKNETILDPACGTAGFLISSFKYILKENTKKKPGDMLTVDERKKLLTNFKGYDISPDMVRLSLVNLYLHGFVQPQIFEYDTLASEDRWNEYADVIMANPPFMSPKGGIKPHKKFSVQSNRSEVLFVDYIAEHLRPTGRAAVIVPEGIIFQSAGAYKQLRKMLVEKYLYAVVSLPAGVFNPYSGVKTSILFLDVQLAKKTDAILFVKIENDGFGLGAQRREIDRNDLPDAANLLADYIKAVRSGKGHFEEWNEEKSFKPCCALLVKKEKLAENGEYNLTGDRYRTVEKRGKQKWPMVTLGEVCDINSGNSAPQDEALFKDGKYPFFRTSDVGRVHLSNNLVECIDYLNDEGIKGLKLFNKGTILFPKSGASTFLNHRAILGVDGYVSSHLATIYPNSQKALPEYVYRMLMNIDARALTADQNYPSLKLTEIFNITIPLPPLEVQREIVAEIEGYQKLIDGARRVVENWKPQIEIDPSWPMVTLGEVCDVRDGTHESPKYLQDNGYPLITSKNVKNGYIDFTDVNLISKEDLDKINERSLVEDGDIIMPMIGTIGNPVIVKKDREFAIKNVALIKFISNSKAINQFVKELLDSDAFNRHYQNQSSGSTQKFISLGFIRSMQIPLPPTEVQGEIVAKIEAERKMVEGCRELIAIYEAKIKRVIDKVWGE